MAYRLMPKCCAFSCPQCVVLSAQLVERAERAALAYLKRQIPVISGVNKLLLRNVGAISVQVQSDFVTLPGCKPVPNEAAYYRWRRVHALAKPFFLETSIQQTPWRWLPFDGVPSVECPSFLALHVAGGADRDATPSCFARPTV